MNDLYNAGLLGLCWFVAVNLAVSLLSWIATHRPAGRITGTPGRLLAIRLMPAAVSVFFAAAIFAPAHWRFEPRGTDETFGLGVHLLAGLGAALLARSAWRAASVLRAGRGLGACHALPRLDAGAGVDVYEVDGLRGVSLAGVIRPRILVGRSVRATLTPDELHAAVAHEVAHAASCDNWKRLALYCAPDLFGQTAAARELERRWSAAAECQADAQAVAGDRGRAADLASALLKVARLGTRAPHSPAWSTLHDEPLLAERIHRLLDARVPQAPRRAGAALWAWIAILAGAAAAGSLAGYDLHLLTEALAHSLP